VTLILRKPKRGDMMICSNCGKDVDKLDIICPHCKNRLEDDYDLDEKDETMMDVEKFLSFDDDDEKDEMNDLKLNLGDDKPNNRKADKQDDDDDEYEYYGDDEGGLLSSKALIIILVVVLIVAAGLAVKFLLFNDDYEIVDKGNDNQIGEVVKPDDTTEPNTEDPTDTDKDKETLVVEPRKMNVATAITNSEDANENIDVLRYNSSLKYNSSKDYGVNDINNSKTFDNYWEDVDGEPYYYDEAIATSLISFNSSWIDYINDGTTKVFTMLEKNSTAYKNISGFDNDGVTEEFLLFEIGDIRKGSEGFYVWTHEKIKVMKDGETEVKEYYWIYKLVEDGHNFDVSNYYRY